MVKGAERRRRRKWASSPRRRRDDNLFERPTCRIPAAADRGVRPVVVHSHVRLDNDHAAPEEWKRFNAALLRLQLLQQRVLVQRRSPSKGGDAISI
ncbi:hypothetical protein AB1Y20_002311 [Prymnesium parvum]|uniref:Uncharacterized protein n=1 Tax=Prymnesium parvum TaxID=97485 RepID=A0AB34JAX1_PRYPA